MSHFSQSAWRYPAFLSGFLLTLWAVGLGGIACFQTRSQLKRETLSEEGAPFSGTEPQSFSAPPPRAVIVPLSEEVQSLKEEIEGLERRLGELEGATRLPKESKQGLLLLLNSLENQQKKQQAELSELKEKVWQDPAPLLQSAQKAFEHQQPEDCLQAVERYLALPRPPEPHTARFLRARCLSLNRQHAEAVTSLSDLLEDRPSEQLKPAILSQLGLSLEALGKKKEALGFFEELITTYPQSSEAKHWKKRHSPSLKNNSRSHGYSPR